jgi:hypothetical protein
MFLGLSWADIPWALAYAVGITLQILVIQAMLRNEYFRLYPAILVYCAALVVTSVVEQLALRSFDRNTYARIYWTDDLVINLLLFLVVILLILQALGDEPLRGPLGRLVAAGVLLILAHSLYVLQPWSRGYLSRMTEVSRNLNFAAAILNLILWSVLVRRQRGDLQMLLVSAGVGLKVTAIAVAHALRQWGLQSIVVDLLIPAADILCLYIWWRTFRRPMKLPARQRP